MAKAQAEMDDVVGPNGVVQESHISDLPYLQALVKETLRLPHQVLINAWAIGLRLEHLGKRRAVRAREVFGGTRD
ncbi:hypothetical protein F2Q70_00026423 [Brassica cretica]|uniref:Uncharacterized protein n=1 Tax=Brassica cretica TaxID=69181 RepID=A0A8S9LE69_BRACR|nr:hypothetical protein F2Q70_00026423 [Brassica cretica]